MRRRCLLLLIIVATFSIHAERKPKEKGWIDLFNGRDFAGWHLRKPEGPNGWKVVEGGIYENTKPSTDLTTERDFYNFQLHAEFKLPPGGGNSGIYMRDKYEIQIFNSYGKPISESGCGALYRRIAPSQNVCDPAGEWQTFDITFVNRTLTVFHNGKKIHDRIDAGPMGTGAAGQRPDGAGPLRLQGDHDSISFRNVRIRPLADKEVEKLLKTGR
jgi:hypothetical protein